MSLRDIFTSFISILERNIYGILIKVHNILQKKTCFIKDKNSNDNLIVCAKPGLVSPDASNNDLIIDLQEKDLHDCNV
jgi:hypothetical protein